MFKALQEWFRARRIRRENYLARLQGKRDPAWENDPKQSWLLTQSDGPPSLRIPHLCDESEALDYLNRRFPGAIVDTVDRNWHVIFYRLGRPVPPVK